MKKIIFTIMFMLVSINSIANPYKLNIPDSCYITFAIDESNAEVEIWEKKGNIKISLKEFCDSYARSPLANTWAIEYAVEKWNENTRKVIATHDWNRSNWNYNVKPDYTITVMIKRIVLWYNSPFYDVDIFVIDKNGNTVDSVICIKHIKGDENNNDIYTHRDMMKTVAETLAQAINKK